MSSNQVVPAARTGRRDRSSAKTSAPAPARPTLTAGDQALVWTSEQLARVSAALQTFARADPKEVGNVVGDWGKKKAGDATTKKDRSLGPVGAVKTTGEASAGAGYGAYGSAKAGKVDLGELGKAYEVLAEAGVVTGVRLDASGSIEKQFGPLVAEAKAAFQAFAGAYATVKGKANVSKGEEWWQVGATASGTAEAFAGAKAKADASANFQMKGLGLEVGAEGEALAGAAAKVEGEATFDLNAKQIALGGEVSAFAGAKIKGSVGGKAKLYGRDALGGKLSGELSAGGGGSAKCKFKMSRGVLQIDLSASATAGIGSGAGADLTTDMKPIAVYVWRQFSRQFWLRNPQAAEAKSSMASAEFAQANSKLRKDLRKYRDMKLTQLKRDRADNYVKIEKVQAYIDYDIPRHSLKKHKDTSQDAAIKRVVEEELASPDGLVSVTASVTYGKLESLDLTPADAVDKLKALGDGPATPKVGKHKQDLRKVGTLK